MISLGLSPSSGAPAGAVPRPGPAAGGLDTPAVPGFGDVFQQLVGRWAGEGESGGAMPDGDAHPGSTPAPARARGRWPASEIEPFERAIPGAEPEGQPSMVDLSISILLGLDGHQTRGDYLASGSKSTGDPVASDDGAPDTAPPLVTGDSRPDQAGSLGRPNLADPMSVAGRPTPQGPIADGREGATRPPEMPARAIGTVPSPPEIGRGAAAAGLPSSAATHAPRTREADLQPSPFVRRAANAAAERPEGGPDPAEPDVPPAPNAVWSAAIAGREFQRRTEDSGRSHSARPHTGASRPDRIVATSPGAPVPEPAEVQPFAEAQLMAEAQPSVETHLLSETQPSRSNAPIPTAPAYGRRSLSVRAPVETPAPAAREGSIAHVAQAAPRSEQHVDPVLAPGPAAPPPPGGPQPRAREGSAIEAAPPSTGRPVALPGTATFSTAIAPPDPAAEAAVADAPGPTRGQDAAAMPPRPAVPSARLRAFDQAFAREAAAVAADERWSAPVQAPESQAQPSAAPTTRAAVEHVWGAVPTSAPLLRSSAAPSTPLPAASGPLPAATEAELPSLIVQTIDLRARNGGGEARVRLRPEYLGELTVKVTVERGIVTAELQAESSQVREWIERNELSLRQALGEHGLTLGEILVSDKTPEEAGGRNRRGEPQPDQQPRQQSPRSRRTNANGDEPRFEVVA